jgi:hypothetical protein
MSDLADELEAASPEQRALAREQTKTAEARRERDSARHALRQAEKEQAELRARLDLVESVTDLDPNPPKWLTPARTRKDRHATVCTILSDAHFDEVVNPDEIGGVNAYNRHIATARLRRYFDQVCAISRDQMAGVTIDGCVLMLGGDLVGGDIHEELAQSNEDTLPGTLLYWSEMIAAGVDQLADHFGKVHVPSVVGNHGRRTRKPRSKARARDNFDWLLSHMVARLFVGDDRITWDIPDAPHTLVNVYGTTFRLEHGDSAKGGSGWMGVLGPAMRRDQKMRTTSQALDQPYDQMVIGHWHQLAFLPGVIVNGSSKGYDEYASLMGFGFERPQQAMWLVTPEHGITVQAPVFVSAGRKSEKW